MLAFPSGWLPLPFGGVEGGGFMGFSEPHVWIVWTDSLDCLNRSFELAYAELKVQLVAEGSSSTWRAFGVAMAKARRVNVEGSAFQ